MNELISFYLNLFLIPMGWRTTTALSERLFLLSPRDYVMQTIDNRKRHLHTVRLSIDWFPYKLPFRWVIRQRQYGERRLHLEWSIPYLINIDLKFSFTRKAKTIEVIETRYWSLCFSSKAVSLFWNCIVDPHHEVPQDGARWVFRWTSLIGRCKVTAVKESHGQTMITIPQTEIFPETIAEVDVQKTLFRRQSPFWFRQRTWSWWYLLSEDPSTKNPFKRFNTRRYPGSWSYDQIMKAYAEDVKKQKLRTMIDNR